jgi:aminoglycoside phosphotransferase (APT) family kinase protein
MSSIMCWPVTADEHRRVSRLDGDAVVRAIRAAGGPVLAIREPMQGGEVGAFLVERGDGTEWILTVAPPLLPGEDGTPFDDALELMELARDWGVPVPRYETVIPLPDGSLAVLQERVQGVPVTEATPALVDHVLGLAEIRRNLVAGTRFDGRGFDLYLTATGPGFCHHEPMRTHSDATRDLLARIEAIGAEYGDELSGSDLVHLDYTLGNVLVYEDDPDRVAAIVDWDGARAGDLAIDLAILRFDLSWRAPALGLDVEETLRNEIDDATFLQVWAHASLRLVDWSIRHYPPEVVDHWVGLSFRHL